MTFGQLVYFYEILDSSLQNTIAKDFCIFINDSLNINNSKISSTQISSCLHGILDIRNIVAHNNRLLGSKCKGQVKYIEPLHSTYSIEKNTNRQDVYNIFLILQCYLTRNQYVQLHNTFLEKTIELDNKLNSIDTNEILMDLGFPLD